MRYMLVFVLSVALSACAGAPKVTYGAVPSASNLSYSDDIKFVLAGSLLQIKASVSQESGDQQVTASSVSVETDKVYTISPNSNLLFTTSITKATYRPNTRLLQALGTKVKDNRTDLISQAAKVVGAVLQFDDPVDNKKPKLVLPEFVVDTREWFTSPGAIEDKIIETPAPWKVMADVSAAPADSILAADFFSTPTKRTVAVHSACRTVTLHLTNATYKSSFRLVVNDPTRVQTVRLPSNGSIEFHAGCGADVTDGESPYATDAALLAKLTDEAKSLLATQNKK